jgi:hypothetical protein
MATQRNLDIEERHVEKKSDSSLVVYLYQICCLCHHLFWSPVLPGSLCIPYVLNGITNIRQPQSRIIDFAAALCLYPVIL